jgi:hypothetical protein
MTFWGRLISSLLIFTLVPVVIVFFAKSKRLQKKYKSVRDTARIFESFHKLRAGDYTAEEPIKFPLLILSTHSLIVSILFGCIFAFVFIATVTRWQLDKNMSVEENVFWSALFSLATLLVIVFFLKTGTVIKLEQEQIKIASQLRWLFTLGRYRCFRYDEIENADIRLKPSGRFGYSCKVSMKTRKESVKFSILDYTYNILLFTVAMKDKLNDKVQIGRKRSSHPVVIAPATSR